MKRISSKIKKVPALSLAAIAAFSIAGCMKKNNEDFLNDVVTRENYDSVYAKIGGKVTIADVVEKEDGRAYASVDGVEYELGMDFLSMAMVYNTKPAAGFATAEAAYNEWWRLFMQRWN